MTDVPETIQEAVAETAEAVADHTEAFAVAVRSLTKAKIQFTALGYAMGAATGAFIAWKIAYSRAETKFSQIADEEIAEMRDHYQRKAVALDSKEQKISLEELVTEKGYVSTDDEKPPMAVTPPPAVVEAAAETVSEETTRVPPPVPVKEAEPVEVEHRNIFRDAGNTTEIMDSWDYQKELRLRSPDAPYVIHYDERNEFEDYQEMTLTYYDGDNVLCNERDEVIGEGIERDTMVGEGNLNRFGHGSNDPQIVYVRNDKLELVFEIVKSPNSYAEEVHGFTHDSYSNIERMRRRERDNLDEDG